MGVVVGMVGFPGYVVRDVEPSERELDRGRQLGRIALECALQKQICIGYDPQLKYCTSNWFSYNYLASRFSFNQIRHQGFQFHKHLYSSAATYLSEALKVNDKYLGR